MIPFTPSHTPLSPQDSRTSLTDVILSPQGPQSREAKAWQLYSPLGGGSSSSVFLARELCSDEVTSLLQTQQSTSQETRRISTPISLLSPITPTNNTSLQAVSFTSLSSAPAKVVQACNILRLCADIEGVVQLRAVRRIPSEDSVYTVADYCEGGDLYSHIRNKKNQEHPKRVLHSIARTVQQLHQRNVIHGDIKPENILLQNGLPRLGDFECSYMPDNPKFPMQDKTEGTLFYRAPYPRGIHESPQSRDRFALGCTIYFALTEGQILAEAILQKKGGSLKDRSRDLGFFYASNTSWEDISATFDAANLDAKAQDLLKKMLYVPSKEEYEANSVQEFTMGDVLAHPFFQDGSLVEPPIDSENQFPN